MSKDFVICELGKCKRFKWENFFIFFCVVIRVNYILWGLVLGT